MNREPISTDDLFRLITVYAQCHALAETCRVNATDARPGPDRDNLNARAAHWAHQAGLHLATIAEHLYGDVPVGVYARPDAFKPVHLPAPGMRLIEVRGYLPGDRSVTIAFELDQAVITATTMIVLAGLANDAAGRTVTALVRPLDPGTGR